MTRLETPLWLARVGPPLLLVGTLGGGVAALYGGQPQGALAFAEDAVWRLTAAEPGRLAVLHVQPGDLVRQGAPLATLDATVLDGEIGVLEAQLRQLEIAAGADAADAAAAADALSVQLADATADLTEARANAAALQRQVARLRAWATDGLGASADLPAAETELATVEAAIRGLSATVDALQRALSNARANARDDAPGPSATRGEKDVVAAEIAALRARREALTLRAPGDGRVAAVYALPGAAVDAALPVVEVVPEGTHRVVACLIEREAAGVVPGQRAVVWPLDGSEGRDATVVATGSRWAAPDPRCQTVMTRFEFVLPVYLTVDAAEPALPPGLRATVRFRKDGAARAAGAEVRHEDVVDQGASRSDTPPRSDR